MRPALLLFSATLLLATPALPAQTAGCKEVDSFLQTAAASLPGQDAAGDQAFATFRKTATEAARKAGASVSFDDPKVASCLLRRYVIAHYGDRMIADLQAMVRFQTAEVQGKENWDLPEFVRQREWLAAKARALGLEFKSYDGRVEEITLPGPKPVLALLTHGDVQGVEGQHWSSPPYEAKLVDGRIIGRGTEDDKGPIVAALYVMAALRDAHWPLDSTLRLLIANGEESSWAEIP